MNSKKISDLITLGSLLGLLGGGALSFFSLMEVFSFRGFESSFFLKILWFITYPITTLSCLVLEGRMCVSEEIISSIVAGPFAGLLIGMLISYFIYKNNKLT